MLSLFDDLTISHFHKTTQIRAMAFQIQTQTQVQWLYGLAIIFLVSSVAVLSFSKRQRETVLSRIGLRRRRTSGASTPPRTLSISKESGKIPAASTSSQPDYVNVFPPSRRSALAELPGASTSQKLKELIAAGEPSPETLQKETLPTTRSYDLDNDVPKYTPTGFSTEEIKALGNFPRYDILSGVPLPEPYEKFDPTTARPRPYRPFRWAYHQTMCNKPHSSLPLTLSRYRVL